MTCVTHFTAYPFRCPMEKNRGIYPLKTVICDLIENSGDYDY